MAELVSKTLLRRYMFVDDLAPRTTVSMPARDAKRLVQAARELATVRNYVEPYRDFNAMTMPQILKVWETVRELLGLGG